MPDFSLNDIEQFLSYFPEFKKSVEEDKICLSGTVVIEADGNRYDFVVKMHAPEKYPNRFPKVFELSEKIKKIDDWHVNSDGTFCFTVEPIEIIACKDGISLIDFYTKWLVPYLSNQQYRINEGKYANGEYSHGAIGVYEYYAELLRTKNIWLIEKYLNTALQTKKIERTSICYCGSGKKYRHCHKDATIKLWQSGDEVLSSHLSLFRSVISKLN